MFGLVRYQRIICLLCNTTDPAVAGSSGHADPDSVDRASRHSVSNLGSNSQSEAPDPSSVSEAEIIFPSQGSQGDSQSLSPSQQDPLLLSQPQSQTADDDDYIQRCIGGVLLGDHGYASLPPDHVQPTLSPQDDFPSFLDIFKAKARTALHVPKVARCEFCKAFGECLANVVSDPNPPFLHWKRLLMFPAAVLPPKSVNQPSNGSSYGLIIKERCHRWRTQPNENLNMWREACNPPSSSHNKRGSPL